MKKYLLGALTLTVLMITACAQQKKTSKVSTNTNNKQSKITRIAMNRTACFGTCPVYELEIKEDGSLKYIGRSFTDYKGIYTSKISTDVVKEIFSAFEAKNVDTCSNEYHSLIQDVPGIFYNIDYGKKEQEIKNAHFGPRYLIDLSLKIDSLIKVDDSWTKTGDLK